MFITSCRTSAISRNYLLIFPVLFVLLSCEEVIKVSLKNETPRIVIESFISDGMNPIVVKITKSQALF